MYDKLQCTKVCRSKYYYHFILIRRDVRNTNTVLYVHYKYTHYKL